MDRIILTRDIRAEYFLAHKLSSLWFQFKAQLKGKL